MEKIKGRLLSEKRRIEEAEERRKARDNKKKAKEVKQRQQNGYPGDNDMGLSFESGKESDKAKKNKRPGVSPWDRDTKNGFGGKKGLNKQNTAEMTNDSIGFNKGDSVQNKKRKK
ncbi:hypothetical protein Tco_0999223 [Tanacetum coccineum]